eukprot:2162071-Prymnesium_polylepis.1
MLLRPRWGAGRMMHPPRRLRYITNSRFLCLGASRATDTVMHNPLGTQHLGRRSGGQSVRASGSVASQPVCLRHRATRGDGVGVEKTVPRDRLTAVRGT